MRRVSPNSVEATKIWPRSTNAISCPSGLGAISVAPLLRRRFSNGLARRSAAICTGTFAGSLLPGANV